MTATDFSAKWDSRFADNTTFLIDEADLREFKDDLLLVFGLVGVNVPVYVPGATYTVSYLVRYTPLGGKEGFYYSLNPGKLSAPGPGNTTDWKEVLGPVAATALWQAISLVVAQGLEGAGVQAGRLYQIDVGPDARGYTQYVYLHGLDQFFDTTRGVLEVDGVRTAVQDIDLFTVPASWTSANNANEYVRGDAAGNIIIGVQGASHSITGGQQNLITGGEDNHIVAGNGNTIAGGSGNQIDGGSFNSILGSTGSSVPASCSSVQLINCQGFTAPAGVNNVTYIGNQLAGNTENHLQITSVPGLRVAEVPILSPTTISDVTLDENATGVTFQLDTGTRTGPRVYGLANRPLADVNAALTALPAGSYATGVKLYVRTAPSSTPDPSTILLTLLYA